ncbi:MAG: XRE family transcriptional regulator [Nostoc sp.]|uniref:helix-turn-helix domain-containing protein n=1 Tax=unclassified Nostoc TaxID=2593658 RepID=UPI0026121064|nr:XRE family transcriptional regulator [Nostoc sp. S13]MDF5735382.1 XRE family transcriptional regulator [Nostoc sp. S13]
MTFDYALLGKKLREVREDLKIDVLEAAARLRISVDDYVKIESGQKKATGDQVVLLASLYQEDFRYFVTGDYPSARSQITEMFRLNASLSKNDRIAIQTFVRLCEYENLLEKEILNKKYNILHNYGKHQFRHNYFKRQGEEAASFERERLLLGISPIRDIFELTRNQGIHVFKRQLEDRNISGLYINHPTAGHCILINYLEDIYRQNFSAAHEYCHALFDSELGQEVSYLDKETNKFEWRANSFARNFLLPKKIIEEDYHPVITDDDWINVIRQIATRFYVSSQVVVIQLKEMDWIDEDLKNQLMNERRLVIKSIEKFDPELPPDLSTGQKERLTQVIRNGLSWYFIELCIEAYRRKEITYHKVLEMFSLPLEQGYQILNDFRTFLEVTEL